MSKLQAAIALFIEKGASWAKVDNLTQLEMCAIRPFFPHSLEHLHRFRMVFLLQFHCYAFIKNLLD